MCEREGKKNHAWRTCHGARKANPLLSSSCQHGNGMGMVQYNRAWTVDRGRWTADGNPCSRRYGTDQQVRLHVGPASRGTCDIVHPSSVLSTHPRFSDASRRARKRWTSPLPRLWMYCVGSALKPSTRVSSLRSASTCRIHMGEQNLSRGVVSSGRSRGYSTA
jgi:hypothetical protein